MFTHAKKQQPGQSTSALRTSQVGARQWLLSSPNRTLETQKGRRLVARLIQQKVPESAQQPQAQGILRKATAESTEQPEKARRLALNAVSNMESYLAENILFDFWGGDLRDNDKNGVVDGRKPDGSRGADRKETQSTDGDHYSGSFPGFKTYAGLTFTGEEGGDYTTEDFETSTPVKYRVCADLVSEAYREAGIAVPHTRRVADLVSWFKTSRQTRFWTYDSFPGGFLPGDFICSYSPRERHGHAGMVVAEGGNRPLVVHLPGQSQHLARGVYDPTRVCDVTYEVWPSNRAIYGIGRFIGSR
jgi:hypothetical protein